MADLKAVNREGFSTNDCRKYVNYNARALEGAFGFPSLRAKWTACL